MKLVKSLVFIALLLVVGYGLYLYFSPKTPDNSLIAQVQTGAIIESGSVSIEDIDRTFILNSGQRITRHGRKVGGEHFGLADAVSGAVLLSGTHVIGGGVEVDLSTIQVEGLTGTLNDQLIVHLKDSFFEVQKYPKATLEILGTTGFVESDDMGSVSGEVQTGIIVNLTMHGITNQIVVPAAIEFTGKSIVLDSVFYIDRTQRGIVEAEGVVDKYFGISGKLTFSQE